MRQYVKMRAIEKTMMMNPLVGWAVTRKGMIEKPGPMETSIGYECETRLYTEAVKSETVTKGWQPGLPMVQGNVGVLQLTKNGGQLMIKAQGRGQISKVSMALMGQ